MSIGMTSVRHVFCVVATTFALVATANATSVVRTFVSGTGDDGNVATNCSRPNPCRTLAQALTVTVPGGEIYTLNPGGYGPVIIGGPISIIGAEGSAIAVATGTTGITINAGATDKIFIRGIVISGAGASNTTGIALNGGLLVLDGSVLKALTTGLTVTGTHADLGNTVVVGNGTGIVTNGAGVSFNSGVGAYLTGSCNNNCVTLVRMSGGSVVDNGVAFTETNPTNVNNAPTATFWNSGVVTNVAGPTPFMTVTGTGATPGSPPGLQQGAPN